MTDARPRVRAHVIAQAIIVLVTIGAWASNPALGRPGGDLAIIWGVLVLVAGPAAALAGTLVGLGEERVPRAPVVVPPLVALGASLASVFVVYALSAELTSCAVPGTDVCAASRGDRVMGVVGIETAVVLYAVSAWVGRQVRRSWVEARAA